MSSVEPVVIYGFNQCEQRVPDDASILSALPNPVLAVAGDGFIIRANHAAEQFFGTAAAKLAAQRLPGILPFASPLLALVEQVRKSGAGAAEYELDLGSPRTGRRVVDAHCAPMGEGAVLIVLRERAAAEKMDRQFAARASSRAASAMAAILAHEIKNPLSGIRGAAQLMESADRALSKLICDETDRIVKLVERMEIFADGRPLDCAPVNIHEVLDHVRKLASASFARHIRFVETYDPSLPPVPGERDRLVQVFLNLFKNAADAIGAMPDGEIHIATAYRPLVRIAVPGAPSSLELPLEVTLRDNGAGVPPEILGTIFDPFVTTKPNGVGLGLALVAKIVADHGGVIECESAPRRTIFRVNLPIARNAA